MSDDIEDNKHKPFTVQVHNSHAPLPPVQELLEEQPQEQNASQQQPQALEVSALSLLPMDDFFGFFCNVLLYLIYGDNLTVGYSPEIDDREFNDSYSVYGSKVYRARTLRYLVQLHNSSIAYTFNKEIDALEEVHPTNLKDHQNYYVAICVQSSSTSLCVHGDKKWYQEQHQCIYGDGNFPSEGRLLVALVQTLLRLGTRQWLPGDPKTLPITYAPTMYLSNISAHLSEQLQVIMMVLMSLPGYASKKAASVHLDLEGRYEQYGIPNGGIASQEIIRANFRDFIAYIEKLQLKIEQPKA